VEFAGTTEMAAPRAEVWALLMDPRRLAACAPGVEAIEQPDPEHATLKVKIGVGAMTFGLTLALEVTEIRPPDGAAIRARGTAPGAQVEATARTRLSGPPEGPTSLDWSAEVELSGSLAGLGSRLIEGTAARLIDQTFDCLRAQLAGS
jgi:carbon monoxide dehydrogenase subunit G